MVYHGSGGSALVVVGTDSMCDLNPVPFALCLLSYSIIVFTAVEVRKYLRCGCSSKMPDNEHPVSVLRNEIFAVNTLPDRIIPEFIQRFEDGAERVPFVMGKESFDVLKE